MGGREDMTAVRAYNRSVARDAPMCLLPARLLLKNGSLRDVDIDLENLRSALTSSGGPGLMELRLPARDEPILAAICGHEIDRLSGKVSRIKVKEVGAMDFIRQRVTIAV